MFRHSYLTPACPFVPSLFTCKCTKSNYEETRLLYIGLFSRTPNNLLAGNYTELLPEIIRRFHEVDEYGTDIFKVLLLLQKVAETGKDRVKSIFSDAKLFNRYYEPDSPVYRCFVNILALCGAVGVDVTDRIQVGSKRSQRIEGKIEISAEYERMKEFFRKSEILLEEKPLIFLDYYVAAFNVWMREIGSASEDESEARQNMHNRTKKMSFSQSYITLCNDVKTMRAMAGQSQ